MKKVILSVIVLSSILIACKKDDEPTPPVCAKTMAGIAANYKMTRVDFTVAGITTDVTSSYLSDDCARNAIFQLRATDSTVLYSQPTTPTVCPGSGSGIWLVRNDSLYVSTNGSAVSDIEGKITGWDCTTLTVVEDLGAQSYKLTLTKQ